MTAKITNLCVIEVSPCSAVTAAPHAHCVFSSVRYLPVWLNILVPSAAPFLSLSVGRNASSKDARFDELLVLNYNHSCAVCAFFSELDICQQNIPPLTCSWTGVQWHVKFSPSKADFPLSFVLNETLWGSEIFQASIHFLYSPHYELHFRTIQLMGVAIFFYH